MIGFCRFPMTFDEVWVVFAISVDFAVVKWLLVLGGDLVVGARGQAVDFGDLEIARHLGAKV